MSRLPTAPCVWGPLVEEKHAPLRAALPIVCKHLNVSRSEALRTMLSLEGQDRSPAGRYVLLRRLDDATPTDGEPRPGVYVALDRVLVRDVAIKLYPATDEQAAREARVAAIVHPNIIEVHDFGEHDGCPYTVMELGDATLGEWAKDKPWPQIIARILQAGRGLAYLHARGYVHGDIKPSNILIRGGVAKIADFGISDRPGKKIPGGTPGYVAPELLEHQQFAPAVDVFALAVTTWVTVFGPELLGEAPPSDLPSDDDGAAMWWLIQIVEGKPLEPVHVPPGCTWLVIGAITSGLMGDPAQRPSLRKWMRELRAMTELALARERARRRRCSPRMAAGALASVIAGFAIVACCWPVDTTPIGETIIAEVNLAREKALAPLSDADKGAAVVHAVHQAWLDRDQRTLAELAELAAMAEAIAVKLDDQRAGIVRMYAASFAWEAGIRERTVSP
jgi:hypothetical protein